MEKDRKYKIIFDDGENIKNKILIYKSTSGSFSIFLNPNTNLEESINNSRIIRIEEVVE